MAMNQAANPGSVGKSASPLPRLAATRNSEEQSRVLFEMNPLPLWVYDLETLEILEVNEAAVRHYGYSREECLKFTLADIRPPEDVPRLQAYFDQHVRGHPTGNVRFAGGWRHRKKDGTLIDVEITSSTISYQGRCAGLGVIKDITEEKKALDAIRESEATKTRLLEQVQEREAWLRSIFENAPSYILQIDREGQILFVNRLHPNRRKEDVLGTRLQDWASKEFRPHFIQTLSRVFETGESQTFEAPAVGADDQEAWYSSSIGPVIVAGKVTSAIVIAHDVTQLKRHEQQLREYTERLQALSRRLIEVQEQERRHLARELHDEIGQILTGLRLSLDVNARAAQADSTSGLDQAQQLVRDLAARVRDLSLHLRPTMLDDLGLLPALLWHFQRYTGQTNLQVDFEHHGIDRRLPTELETGVYRIVQEGLTNAARHGQIDHVRVCLWIDNDVLGLRIEDEGVGFEPGKVLKSQSSSGLSGMQERANLLGGQFHVESARGSGTRLLAEFPIPDSGNGASHGHDHSARR
jgi:PAS domain S-box-containing protein